MARLTVNPHQLQVLDYIVHLNATVVAVKHVLAGRYLKIKQNMLITLNDNRVILAKQRLVMNVHKSGAFTVPWNRVELPYSFEIERPDPPSKEPETTKVWPIKHDDCPEYHPTVNSVPGGRWR